MKIAFPQYFESESRFLSYTVVAKALRDAGHNVTNDIDGCDFVAFSICDVTEYPALVRLRAKTKKPIVVGGSFAFNFWSAKIYSDAVWVGEIYDFAKLKSVDEILGSKHCFTGGPLPTASMRIDWPAVPIAQIKKTMCYYWGGVGCKNKCKFCFTSWTHKHEVNSPERIEAAKRICAKRKVGLMISSNEYENATGGKTMDMMMKDYIATAVPKTCLMVRVGVEFATESARAEMGKPLSKNDLYCAVQKMASENIAMRWFHIAGMEEVREWDRYISDLCAMLDRHRNGKLLHLMFNNLQYQNYTPLYSARKSIDPEKYITHENTKAWYNRLRERTSHVLVGAPSQFQHVACRMGIELATEKQQLDFWLARLSNSTHKMTKKQTYDNLFSSGIMETPHLMMDGSGRIFELQAGGRAK